MHYSVLETIDILSRTPATLGALIDGLPETWLVKDEGGGTFSPRDVVGHLILGEKTDWVPRIDCILRCGQEEAFVPFDRFNFRQVNIGCSTSELCAPGRVLFNISEGEKACRNTKSHKKLKSKGFQIGRSTIGKPFTAYWMKP